MVRRIALAALTLILPAAAMAQQGEVLAEYWSRSATVAPQYAWSLTVSIGVDGRTTVKRCTGYESEGPACRVQVGMAGPDSLEAIRAATAASGFLETPAGEASEISVGGETSGGTVYLEGVKVVLPAFPAARDVPGVDAVLNAIVAAIPRQLKPLNGG
jgi:hypothetical protein